MSFTKLKTYIYWSIEEKFSNPTKTGDKLRCF